MKTNNLFLLLFILAAPDRIPGQGRGKPPTKALHRDDPAASGRKLPAAARGEGSISISAKAPPSVDCLLMLNVIVATKRRENRSCPECGFKTARNEQGFALYLSYT